MASVWRLARALPVNEEGATAVEYGLIAALIVIAMIGGLSQLGGGAGGMWTELSAAVALASGGSGS